MKPEQQTEYIVQCLRDSGSMYEDDARKFLAEHDAHVRTEALTERQRGPENYPGELAMLRGLLGVLRVTAKHGDFRQMQQLLAEHERDEQDAYAGLGEEATPTGATATPDFFQPGHTYTREHHAATVRFLVRGVSWAPDHSYRVAFGWRVDEDGDWEFTDSDDMDGWTDATEAGDR
jgi:hypothetical protein